MGPEHAAVVSYDTEPSPFNFGLVVPRTVLDDRIRLAAQGAGADLAEDAEATDLRTDESGVVRGVWLNGPGGRRRADATITVIADGATGRLGRHVRAGRSQDSRPIAIAVRQYFDGVRELQPYFEFHAPVTWQARSLVGYGWIFPVGETMANVGLGLLSEHKHLDEALVHEVFRAFLAGLCSRDRRLDAAYPLGPIEGGSVSACLVDPTLTPPGALLVGDAAGLVNVFTGEGIAYALESGELAARAVHRNLHNPARATRSYGAQLVGRYPYHWAMRGTSRCYRWLLSLSPNLVEGRQTSGLLAALRRFALDEAPLQGDGASPASSQTTAGRRLENLIRSRAVSLLRQRDPMLAELLNDLLRDDGTVAASNLSLATALIRPADLLDAVVIDALLAVILFSVGDGVLESVGGRAATPGGNADRAHVVIGDCLVTEATAVLCGLPTPVFRLVSAAFRDSACARLTPARASSSRARIERYAALASPAVCAAVLASGGHGLDEAPPELVAFARWYGGTQRAIVDLREGPDADLADYVRDCSRSPVPPPTESSVQLHKLASELRTQAYETLAAVDASPHRMGGTA
jgi:flavin-dependent dehydrogenase